MLDQRPRRRDEAIKRFQAQEAKRDRPKKIRESRNLSQADRASANGVGEKTKLYLDRLARDHPELLAKVNAGEMKPYTAAREAGIVRVPTEFQAAQKAFLKLSARDRKKILAWMAQLE